MNAKWKANWQALGKCPPAAETLKTVKVVRLASIAEAAEHEKAWHKFTGSRQGHRGEVHAHVQASAVSGDAEHTKRALAESDGLIDAVIACEPRLARKAQWIRSDDGIFADAGLVASGDDSPCYDMSRAKFRDVAAAGEPVVVCVSTDSSEPKESTMAAFIATVRLVQQFRPVHVWWQGAWLCDSGREAGYVFLSPLVSNDMDFSRVQYVLADNSRDHLSFGVLHQHCTVRDHLAINGIGRHAERAYIDGAKFVDRNGIPPNAERIAAVACQWLGWPSTWENEWDAKRDRRAALQSIPVEYVDTRTDDEKERDRIACEKSGREYDKRRADARAASVAQRLSKVVEGGVMG